MKTLLLRYSVLSLTIGTATLMSCSTDNSAAEAQSKVDSIVNAKTLTLNAQMKRNNDSLIDAMALARADSMMPAKPIAPAKK